MSSAIESNLARVRERIRLACERAGRDPAEVTLIAVTKGFPADTVVAACRAGLQDIGENRVQEAAEKAPLVEAQGARPRWHLIGHLQRNKVKTALNLFDIIHSIDSLRLAETVSRAATGPVSALIEVNAAGEASKFGVPSAEVESLLREIERLPNLEVRGLMTVAPLVANPEEVRPVFRELRRLASSLGLPELSMGMSDDFETAIEEGSTMVRIGRALFGSRLELLEESRPGTE